MLRSGEKVTFKITAYPGSERARDGAVHSFVVRKLRDQGWDVRLKEGVQEFTLTAPYGIWVDILRGHLNATKALSLRKLKVKGPFLKLLKNSSSTDRWIEILQSIPTEFDGEFEKYNVAGS